MNFETRNIASILAGQAAAVAADKVPADQLAGHMALLEASLANLKTAIEYTAAKPAKPARPAQKRISAKYVGEKLNLAFHGTYDRTVDENTLIKLEGEGDDARATFRDASGMEWEAYRYNGRWAYGSGAHRLTVVQEDGVVHN
jgi:hypothetical protein